MQEWCPTESLLPTSIRSMIKWMMRNRHDQTILLCSFMSCHLLQLLDHHDHDLYHHQYVSDTSQIPCSPPFVTSLIFSALTPVRGEVHRKMNTPSPQMRGVSCKLTNQLTLGLSLGCRFVCSSLGKDYLWMVFFVFVFFCKAKSFPSLFPDSTSHSACGIGGTSEYLLKDQMAPESFMIWPLASTSVFALMHPSTLGGILDNSCCCPWTFSTDLPAQSTLSYTPLLLPKLLI